MLYAYMPAGTILDGEVVRWNPSGRLEFSALQRRYANRRRAKTVAQTEPCQFAIFDVLEEPKHGDLRRTKLAARRRILGVPSGTPLASSRRHPGKYMTPGRGPCCRWREDLRLIRAVRIGIPIRTREVPHTYTATPGRMGLGSLPSPAGQEALSGLSAAAEKVIPQSRRSGLDSAAA